MPKPSPAVAEIRLSQRLGAAIQKARQDIGISQSELAKRTGLSKSYLNYLEAGRYDEIGIGKFALLVEALDISADEMLRRAGIVGSNSPRTPSGTRVLSTQFGLDPAQTRSALDYVSYLKKQKAAPARSPK